MKILRIARRFLASLTLGSGFWCLLGTLPVSAASTSVSIVDFSFNPPTVTIHVNDTVVWNWVGPTTHTSTSDTGVWDSGFLSSGNAQFTHAFTSSGSFPYHCNVHPTLMMGTVTVQGQTQTNVPPAVSITAPTNGAIFAAPWTGTIKATASDSDGTVTQIQFMAGATVLGTLNSPPANPTLTVTNLAAGDYILTAVATDNGGASTTSSGIRITVVAPAPISLGSVKKPSAASFQLSYSTTAGLGYVVQRSADLIHWNPVATNSASGSQASFTDTTATAAANFYRVELLPNP
jgi:plastocyanin